MTAIEIGDSQNIGLYKDSVSSIDVLINLNDEIFDFNAGVAGAPQVNVGQGRALLVQVVSCGCLVEDIEDVIAENNLNLEGDKPTPPLLEQVSPEFLPNLEDVLTVGSIRSQSITDTIVLSRTAKTIVNTLTNNYKSSIAGSGSSVRFIR
jgi:hypothetical protein